MAIVHSQASGMGGIRTAGDLVSRMQLAKNMRLNEAKKYVADKLGVSLLDLTDEVIMRERREELDIGTIFMGYGAGSRGIEAKANISKLLGLDINCVEKFSKKTGMYLPSHLQNGGR
jgi:dimethylamine--corrinoid protein Co-methyltransferase